MGPDSLELSIMLNAGSYAIGEAVVMTLQVRNVLDRSVSLTFPSAQSHDFIVRKGKKIIWRWSHGMMFAQVLRRHEVAPGKTMSFEYEWDQITIDGERPGLGRYTVQGVVATAPRMVTEEKPFGIVD
jgi:hypothetical protein